MTERTFTELLAAHFEYYNHPRFSDRQLETLKQHVGEKNWETFCSFPAVQMSCKQDSNRSAAYVHVYDSSGVMYRLASRDIHMSKEEFDNDGYVSFEPVFSLRSHGVERYWHTRPRFVQVAPGILTLEFSCYIMNPYLQQHISRGVPLFTTLTYSLEKLEHKRLCKHTSLPLFAGSGSGIGLESGSYGASIWCYTSHDAYEAIAGRSPLFRMVERKLYQDLITTRPIGKKDLKNHGCVEVMPYANYRDCLHLGSIDTEQEKLFAEAYKVFWKGLSKEKDFTYIGYWQCSTRDPFIVHMPKQSLVKKFQCKGSFGGSKCIEENTITDLFRALEKNCLDNYVHFFDKKKEHAFAEWLRNIEFAKAVDFMATK